MPAAWFSDGEQAFESIKVPCIDVCTLIPASVISALAYCNLLFNRLPNFALHRLHIFSPQGSAPLPGASCWGQVLKVFIPGLVQWRWVTLWILHFWTPHLLAGLSSPLVPMSVCGWSQCPPTMNPPWASPDVNREQPQPWPWKSLQRSGREETEIGGRRLAAHGWCMAHRHVLFCFHHVLNLD